jgi:hypothetical protein
LSETRINDPIFYNLANNIARLLKENNQGKKLSKSEFTKNQSYQVERMMELERMFKSTINIYKQSDQIYQKFLLHIKIEKGNILTARPYFREDSKTFGDKISPAFKEEDIQLIKKFDINYKFMQFVIENWKGNLPKKAEKIWEEHQFVRQKVVENSMPLAINMAMKFFKSTPRTHVTLMDMVNASILGLCIATDKWVGPFSTVFRSVCIGRMKSNIMDVYNQTVLHYYPSDKKIIYKANLLKHREKIEDEKEVLEKINQYLNESGDKRKLEKHELEDLLNGTSIYSDSQPYSQGGAEDGDGDLPTIYDTYCDEQQNVENIAENNDIMKGILFACQKLSVIQRKIIKLKGVEL